MDKVDAFFDSLTESTLAVKVVQGLALPSRYMMFKIIRACVAVTRVEDLWIYGEEPSGQN